jgi:hypothetical protein
MTNVIQGKFSKEESTDKAPPCRECRGYSKENDDHDRFGYCLLTHKFFTIEELMRFKTDLYASSARLRCRGRYFDLTPPKPRTFWQRLGDAIIERLKR